jgi:hypothetical protein
VDVWVATASPAGAAHLVPLSYAWDGERILVATERRSLTARNLEASRIARLGFGPTRDVVIVDVVLDQLVDVAAAPVELADAYARQSGWDPRLETDPYVFFLLRPDRIQAWREANELAGRTLMRDGTWLVYARTTPCLAAATDLRPEKWGPKGPDSSGAALYKASVGTPYVATSVPVLVHSPLRPFVAASGCCGCGSRPLLEAGARIHSPI